MTPKSLLRLPQAVSDPTAFTEGTFQSILDDPALLDARESVTRLVLCSGKIYYDVVNSGHRKAASHVAVARIELLYPFPEGDVSSLLQSYSNLQDVVWLQEEPVNMGARKWMMPQLIECAPAGMRVRYISRPERSSPAEGYPAAHKAEQERLVTEALAP